MKLIFYEFLIDNFKYILVFLKMDQIFGIYDLNVDHMGSKNLGFLVDELREDSNYWFMDWLSLIQLKRVIRSS